MALAVATTTTEKLGPGTVFDLSAGAVFKRIDGRTLRMFAFNGSIPGPTLQVAQDSEVIVHFTNDLDSCTLIHWHGLRMSNLFDPLIQGSPCNTRLQVPPGGSFSYRLHFPDPGFYCYHHELRDDQPPAHGLYGGIIVVPREPGYWPSVNREIVLALDEMLTACNAAHRAEAWSPEGVKPGYDRLILANGDLTYTLQVYRGEVVRFYVANVANNYAFRVRMPGARIKYVGGDLGQIEQQMLVEELELYPLQRAIVDVLFERTGPYRIENHTPSGIHTLGWINVMGELASPRLDSTFHILGQSETLRMERTALDNDLERLPDRTLFLTDRADEPQQPEQDPQAMASHPVPMSAMEHRASSALGGPWKIVDLGTGAINGRINWFFHIGKRAKIRLIHASGSGAAIQHPLHFHGQRFLVLARDGIRSNNLAWQDTLWLAAGETVDILLEAANPGLWLVHCRRLAHERDMQFTLHVQ